jgi:anti-sigma B factor antagonist
MADLNWETAEDGDDALHVTLTGELDISNVERFEQVLMELEQPRPELLVLDLRGVEFIASTGLSLLLNADARARRQSRRVTIVSGSGAARRIMRTVALDQILDVTTEPPKRKS